MVRSDSSRSVGRVSADQKAGSEDDDLLGYAAQRLDCRRRRTLRRRRKQMDMLHIDQDKDQRLRARNLA
ncbi:MAG: hypothetical protein U0892_22450 [Pirellulales bacterium]